MTPVPDDPLWERRFEESTRRRHTLGLPQATAVYRYTTTDGYLWGLTLQDDRGWTLVLTHTTPDLDALIPGRLPTLAECICACGQLIPRAVCMVVLLTRADERLVTSMHVSRPGLMPKGAGLPTTVRCVEASLEFTDDVVLWK